MRPALETLESRLTPSTLNLAPVGVVNGVVLYSANLSSDVQAAGNNVTISVSGSKYVITDLGEEIQLSKDARDQGWEIVDANTVRGPTANLARLKISTEDGNDVVNVRGLLHPLEIDGGDGTDLVSVTADANFDLNDTSITTGGVLPTITLQNFAG
ncbi:MAG TPA: hypothetical protein VKD72_01655, partial [Gemmataceae bacterium]|nr:hypothetical protein [Gemmataceae bacterium]